MGNLIDYLKLTNKKAEKYNREIKKSNVEAKFQTNPFKESENKIFIWIEKE